MNKVDESMQLRSQLQKSTKQKGDAAEDRAMHYLQAQGLKLVHRNYRTPGRSGGEIDLIMQTKEGTLVFVEVRQRGDDHHGGALASITPVKQRRIVFAARHYLMKLRFQPPCRFDAVAVQGEVIHWLQGAFEAY